jgi:hypothetical protein
MEKVNPFLYRYIYFFDTSETFRLGHSQYQTVIDGGIAEAIKDENIETWINATVMSGANAARYHRHGLPMSEYKCWYKVEVRSHMAKEILKKVLLAKPFSATI